MRTRLRLFRAWSGLKTSCGVTPQPPHVEFGGLSFVNYDGWMSEDNGRYILKVWKTGLGDMPFADRVVPDQHTHPGIII